MYSGTDCLPSQRGAKRLRSKSAVPNVKSQKKNHSSSPLGRLGERKVSQRGEGQSSIRCRLVHSKLELDRAFASIKTNLENETERRDVCDYIADALTEAFSKDLETFLKNFNTATDSVPMEAPKQRGQTKNAHKRTTLSPLSDFALPGDMHSTGCPKGRPFENGLQCRTAVPLNWVIEEQVMDGSHLDVPQPSLMTAESVKARTNKHSSHSSHEAHTEECHEHIAKRRSPRLSAARLGPIAEMSESSLRKSFLNPKAFGIHKPAQGTSGIKQENSNNFATSKSQERECSARNAERERDIQRPHTKVSQQPEMSQEYVEEILEDEGCGDIGFDFDEPAIDYHIQGKCTEGGNFNRSKENQERIEEETLDQSDPQPLRSPVETTHKTRPKRVRMPVEKTEVVLHLDSQRPSDLLRRLVKPIRGPRKASRSSGKAKYGTPTKRLKAPSVRVPWWRITHTAQMINKGDEELLRIFVTTVVRTCIRKSWSTQRLQASHQKDPSCLKGDAFTAVSTVMSKIEQERNIGEQNMDWPPDLLRELLERRYIQWSPLKFDPSFDHFLGCEACLKHRRATNCIVLRGLRYNSSFFWPDNRKFSVVSCVNGQDGALLLEAKIRDDSSDDSSDGESHDYELWVDDQCLRRILLFHELSHTPSYLNIGVGAMLEKVLNESVVKLKSIKKLAGNEGAVADHMERFLVKQLVNDDQFVQGRITHLMNIIRLGELYFLPPSDESPDARTSIHRQSKSPKIFDPPSILNDAKYQDCIVALLKDRRTK